MNVYHYKCLVVDSFLFAIDSFDLRARIWMLREASLLSSYIRLLPTYQQQQHHHIMRTTIVAARDCYRRVLFVRRGCPASWPIRRLARRGQQQQQFLSFHTTTTNNNNNTTTLPPPPQPLLSTQLPLIPPAPLETIRPKTKTMQLALEWSVDFQRRQLLRAEALFQAATRQSQDAYVVYM